jgi:hypothetical protein
MQKSQLVITRKDGVRVMVKVRGPEIFKILDQVNLLLKHRVREQNLLLSSL